MLDNIQVRNPINSYNHKIDDHYLVEHNKQLRCICQSCTCGKHHCPRKPIKTDFQTSYSRQFKKYQNIQPTGQRPSYRYDDRHYSPDVLKTNYQDNYQRQVDFSQQRPITNSRLQQLGKAILSPPVPFMGVSSYKQQFQGYKMAKNMNNQNPQNIYSSPVNSYNYKLKNQVKFEGISSYKSTYLAPQIKRQNYQIPSEYKKPEVPFYGSSSYKQQYKPFQIQPHQQVYDSRVYRDSPTIKFQGTSAYKDQFQPYQIKPIKSQYDYLPKNQCKLDQMVLPTVNYINDKEHVYFDPQNKKFY